MIVRPRRGAQASRRDALFADREERNARVSKIQGGLFEAAARKSHAWRTPWNRLGVL